MCNSPLLIPALQAAINTACIPVYAHLRKNDRRKLSVVCRKVVPRYVGPLAAGTAVPTVLLNDEVQTWPQPDRRGPASLAFHVYTLNQAVLQESTNSMAHDVVRHLNASLRNISVGVAQPRQLVCKSAARRNEVRLAWHDSCECEQSLDFETIAGVAKERQLSESTRVE